MRLALILLVIPTLALADAHGQVTALAGRARDAARDRRCDVVEAIGDQVRALDPTYYTTVFATDPTIALCHPIDHRLAPPSTLAPDPAWSEPPLPMGRSAVPEPKSAFVAGALSLGTTLGGVALIAVALDPDFGSLHATAALLGVAAILAGPTLGHVYAGNTDNVGLKIRAAGGVAVLAGAGLIVSGFLAASTRDGGAGVALAYSGLGLGILGLGAYGVGTVVEIATAPGAAMHYNDSHGLMLGLAPLRGRDGTVPGLALAGRF